MRGLVPTLSRTVDSGDTVGLRYDFDKASRFGRGHVGYTGMISRAAKDMAYIKRACQQASLGGGTY